MGLRSGRSPNVDATRLGPWPQHQQREGSTEQDQVNVETQSVERHVLRRKDSREPIHSAGHVGPACLRPRMCVALSDRGQCRQQIGRNAERNGDASTSADPPQHQRENRQPGASVVEQSQPPGSSTTNERGGHNECRRQPGNQSWDGSPTDPLRQFSNAGNEPGKRPQGEGSPIGPGRTSQRVANVRRTTNRGNHGPQNHHALIDHRYQSTGRKGRSDPVSGPNVTIECRGLLCRAAWGDSGVRGLI